MGKGERADPARAAHRLRQDRRVRKDHGGLRPGRRACPDSGAPRGASGAGGRQARKDYGAGVCSRKGGAVLPRQLVPGCGRLRPDDDAGKPAASAPGRLFQHHYHR